MVRKNGFAFFIILFIYLLNAATGAAQEVTLNVTVDKNQLALDDQLNLTVSVSGSSQDLPNVRINNIPNFTIVGQSTSQNFQITNGATSVSKDTRLVVVPQKEGDWQIGPFQLSYKGKTYQSNVVQVKVSKAGATVSGASAGNRGDAFIDVIIDKKDPYLNEQVTVTYYLYFKVNVSNVEYDQLPTATGFWAEELDVPKDRTGNFLTEQKTLNGIRYNRVIIRKMALFPSTIGQLTIGPLVLKAYLRVQSNDPFDSFFNFGRTEQKLIRSSELTLNVKDLPNQGKPAGFQGAVGRFDLQMKIDKNNLPANDAINLTMTVSGTGNIKSIQDLGIKFPPDFKIYDPKISERVDKSSDQIKGSRTFEYVLIPRYEGEYTIDPLTLSFFSPDKEVYQTVKTQSVTIVATPSLTDESGYSATSAGKKVVERFSYDIRYIKLASGHITDQGALLYKKPVYLASYIFPLFILGIIFTYRKHRDRLESDIGYARQLQASRAAKKLFVNAHKALKNNQQEQFYSAVTHAITSFIADKLNLPNGAVTADTVENILIEKSVRAELINEITNILTTCNFARFAPASSTQKAEMNEIYKHSQLCITQLEKHKFIKNR